jgi:anaerobic selenocysteine-containing dehydrogenase
VARPRRCRQAPGGNLQPKRHRDDGRRGPAERRLPARHQQLELSPEDAERLHISDGDDVTVAQNSTRLHARAAVRTGVPDGTAFLADGIETDSANAFTASTIEISKS